MKHIKTIGKYLNEAVKVETNRYERSHGKKPRGYGKWAFYFDDRGGEPIFTPTPMSYTDAVKWAKGEAKKAGKKYIYVGESVTEGEVLLFDELNDSFDDLETKISKLMDRTDDPKWNKALQAMMNQLEKLIGFAAKQDTKLGVINVNEAYKRGVNGVGSLKNSLAALKRQNITGRYTDAETLAKGIRNEYEAITGEKYEDEVQMSMDDAIADIVSHFKLDGPEFMAAWDRVVKESYDGTLSDIKYDLELALDNLGIPSKALKSVKKTRKGYEVRMSSYMSNKNTWDRIGTDIGADLIDFKKGSINVGIYEKVNLKADHLSSAEYQKAKKLKDFNKNDWSWNSKTQLYDRVTEARNKKVTKQMWNKMSDEKRFDALLSVVKDPDDAEKYVEFDWNDLPSGFERDMTLYENN